MSDSRRGPGGAVDDDPREVFQRRVGRHCCRIWPYCRRDFRFHHRSRARPGHQARHHIHDGVDRNEIALAKPGLRCKLRAFARCFLRTRATAGDDAKGKPELQKAKGFKVPFLQISPVQTALCRDPSTLDQRVKSKELSMSKISAFLRDESGATAIEYGLIAALISVVIITAVRTVGSNLTTTFQAICTALQSHTAVCGTTCLRA